MKAHTSSEVSHYRRHYIDTRKTDSNNMYQHCYTFAYFPISPFHSPINHNQQQQICKVWRPQRAARAKRPNTPSDGSKHNGFQTTNQAVLIPKHVSSQDRAHHQEHHALLHRLQWHGKQCRLPRAEAVHQQCKGLNHREIFATRPNHHGMWPP